MRSVLSLGVLATLASAACTTPITDLNPAGDPPYPDSGVGYGDDDDAGSLVPDGVAPAMDASDAGAPETEASASSIPPIGAKPPGSAPAACSGGAAPTAYLWAADGTLFTFDPTSLETRALGVVSCPTSADPSGLSVTASGSAYVQYNDGGLYAVDLGTLACQRTPYQGGQLGFTGQAGITVGGSGEADRFYVYGGGPSPSLGLSDLSTFRLFDVGAITPGPAAFPVDLKSDAYGRLFALATDGTLEQLDPATGTVIGEDHTGFSGTQGNWALMADDGQLYFFGGVTGSVSRYDLADKALFPMGQVNQTVVGASAVPCLSGGSLPPSQDAGVSANPFSAGNAWIGTYVCAQGLTNLAVVLETVSGNTMNARFDFAVGPTQGSFELAGTFDPATREATFTPGSWVSQPGSDWSTVGMDGFVDLSGDNYSGSITTAGCGAFSVTR